MLHHVNVVSADKPPIQVALVEDDPEIRANIAHRIGRSPAFRLLRSYADAGSALADLPRHPADVVLMDINPQQILAPSAKAGVMIRETLAANSIHATTMLTASNGVHRLYRALTGGGTTHSAGPVVSVPYWLKLTRGGSIPTPSDREPSLARSDCPRRWCCEPRTARGPRALQAPGLSQALAEISSIR
jgi:DNA-binding NarL/FixJ family response regulator